MSNKTSQKPEFVLAAWRIAELAEKALVGSFSAAQSAKLHNAYEDAQAIADSVEKHCYELHVAGVRTLAEAYSYLSNAGLIS